MLQTGVGKQKWKFWLHTGGNIRNNSP